MAEISQYDMPAQSNVVNTYTPIPFNEMFQAGMMKQKQYEQGLDTLSQVHDNMYNLKYAPGTVDEKYIKGVVIPKTEEVFEKYKTKDLSDPLIVRQAMSELNTNIDRNRVKSIQNTAAGYAEYKKEAAKLNQKGKLSPISENPIQGWDSSVHGEFDRLPQEWEDPYKRLEDRWLKPLHDSTLSTYTDEQGNRFVKSGVNRQTINNLVGKSLPAMLSSQEGQEAIQMYKHSRGMDMNDHSKDAQILSNVMDQVGSPYVRENEKATRLNLDKSGKHKASYDDVMGGPVAGTLPTESIVEDPKQIVANMGKLVDDYKSGKIKPGVSPEMDRQVEQAKHYKEVTDSAIKEAKDKYSTEINSVKEGLNKELKDNGFSMEEFKARNKRDREEAKVAGKETKTLIGSTTITPSYNSGRYAKDKLDDIIDKWANKLSDINDKVANDANDKIVNQTIKSKSESFVLPPSFKVTGEGNLAEVYDPEGKTHPSSTNLIVQSIKDNPTSVSPVKIPDNDKLSDNEADKFFRTASKHSFSGIGLNATANGKPYIIMTAHNKDNTKRHQYKVPLTQETQIDAVVRDLANSGDIKTAIRFSDFKHDFRATTPNNPGSLSTQIESQRGVRDLRYSIPMGDQGVADITGKRTPGEKIILNIPDGTVDGTQKIFNTDSQVLDYLHDLQYRELNSRALEQAKSSMPGAHQDKINEAARIYMINLLKN